MTIKNILRKTGILFITGFLFLITACNNAVSNTKNPGKAYVSFSVLADRTINPVQLELDDVLYIELTAERQKESSGEYLKYNFIDDNNQTRDFLCWESTVDDSGSKKSAYQNMVASTVLLEYGTYNFTLKLGTRPTDLYSLGTYNGGYHFSQIGELRDYPVNVKTTSISFSTQYADNGNLIIQFSWPYEDQNNQIINNSRIGKIEVGLFTVESKGETPYFSDKNGYNSEGYKQLSINAPDSGTSFIIEYEESDIPNGSYYLNIRLYDYEKDSSTNEYPLIQEIPLGIVKIHGYKTESQIDFDLEKLNVYYKIDYIFNKGDLSSGRWKNNYNPGFPKRRLAYTDVDLPANDDVEYPNGGYKLVGWYTELDENDNPTGDIITSIPITSAENNTARDFKLYAAWEIEESDDNPLDVSLNDNNISSDMVVEGPTFTIENGKKILTYKVTDSADYSSCVYSWTFDGVKETSMSNVREKKYDISNWGPGIYDISCLIVSPYSGDNMSYGLSYFNQIEIGNFKVTGPTINETTISYTVSPPDSTPYNYTWTVNGETRVSTVSASLTINASEWATGNYEVSLVVTDNKGCYYIYVDTIDWVRGYELQDGATINGILADLNGSGSAFEEATSFARSENIPDYNNPDLNIQSLDYYDEVPVWLDGDTIYYYIPEGYKLILNENSGNMFFNWLGVTSIETSDFYTGRVKDMGSMFENCYALTELDLSMFDVSKVNNMNRMFYGCMNLESIYVTQGTDWRNCPAASNTDEDARTGLFETCTSLPGYDGNDDSTWNLSKAYLGEGGYFTDIAEKQ